MKNTKLKKIQEANRNLEKRFLIKEDAIADERKKYKVVNHPNNKSTFIVTYDNKEINSGKLKGPFLSEKEALEAIDTQFKKPTDSKTTTTGTTANSGSTVTSTTTINQSAVDYVAKAFRNMGIGK